MRYALIKSGVVVETRNMASNFVAEDVAHKFDFRVVNAQPDPVFDPAIERLGDFEYVVNDDAVEATRAVVALTQAEIDAYHAGYDNNERLGGHKDWD